MIFSKKQLFFYIITMLIAILFAYFFIDKTVAHYFVTHAATYEPIGDAISILGESHWYIGAGLLGFLFFKYYKPNELYKNRFLFLLYANLFSGLISLVSKFIFGRIRPWGMRHDGDEFGFLLFQNFDMGFVEKMKYHFATVTDAPTTYTSFPSGHSTTVFAVFSVLGILFPRYIWLWLSIAIITACSRILANDHFISDILAGSMVGVCSTLFIYSKMKGKI